MYKQLFIILASLLPKVYASELAGPCQDASIKVNKALYDAWYVADLDTRGQARDAIWSAKEFSRPYSEIMKIIPGKFSRTKGVYQELHDKLTYAHRLSNETRWENPYVKYYVNQAYYCLIRELKVCYDRYAP